MTDLKEAFTRLKPMLEDYVSKKNSIQKQLIQQGIIPKEICNDCKNKEIEEVIKFDAKTNTAISDFVEWISNNEIREVQCDKKQVYVISKKKQIEGKKGTSLLLGVEIGAGLKKEEPEFEFKFPISKFKRRNYAKLFNFEFYGFSVCKHILDEASMKKALPMILVKTGNHHMFFIGESSRLPTEILKKGSKKINKLRLLCEDCYNRLDKIGCENAISRRGFVYDSFRCNFDEIIFRNLLTKYKIKFNAIESEEHRNGFEYFLPDMNILITKRIRELKEVVEKLNPKIILGFGKQQDIVNFLEYKSSVIIFDDSEDAHQRFFLFDKNKRVEDSMEKVVSHIVSKLNEYSEQIRGKEHDRLIEAFFKIGQDLGFIPQKELPHKGTRVDLVWLDRGGNIYGAIEVETSAQWKKDIVSTWETEPKLAIVVSHYKSEKGIQDILQYVLLENMPHKLLFINNLTKRAYLIEKNSILKYYDLIEKKEVKPPTDIFEY